LPPPTARGSGYYPRTAKKATHHRWRLQLRVDDGNLAAALPIAAAQRAIALLNAATMIPV
jgi:hypothetical protein